MKVAVYAICKNEESFVDRWYESMKEADEIYVLDTGSSDNTVEKLEALGVKVFIQEVVPWRFDVARNYSLDLVSSDVDICVCTDLDEVIEPGWRNILEKVWKKDTTRCRYIYNWKLENDRPIISFYQEKIHSRNYFKWIHPVHEILSCNDDENYVTTDDIIVNHYPDNTKSRSSYLPLLELSVTENPNNDRNMHYLGREYMFYKKYNESIDTLIKHLDLPSATWKDERGASMRFIARSYTALERYNEAKMWLDKSILETPYLRDPLMEKALLLYHLKEYDECELLVNKALSISINNKSYINEVFTFDHTAYDLLAMIYNFRINFDRALYYVDKAIEISPDNERLLNNKAYFEKMLQEKVTEIGQ